MALEVLADLLLQSGARVEHHAQQANDLQLRVQVGMHLLDGVYQIRHAFQGKVFTLHGHHHTMGCAQTIEGEHGQGGRAVHQHKIVIGFNGSQGIFQALFALRQLHQLNLGTRQLTVSAQYVVAAFFSEHSGLAH